MASRLTDAQQRALNETMRALQYRGMFTDQQLMNAPIPRMGPPDNVGAWQRVNPHAYLKPVGPPSPETMRQWLASQPGANWPQLSAGPNAIMSDAEKQRALFSGYMTGPAVWRQGQGFFAQPRLYQDGDPTASQRPNAGTRLPPEYQPALRSDGLMPDGLPAFPPGWDKGLPREGNVPEKISYSASESGMNYVAPITGTAAAKATSPFGAQRGYAGRHHAGIDWQAKNGSQAVAVIGGKVLYVGNNKGYQNNAVILGNDGNAYRYATHGPISLKVGQVVNTGDPVGTIARDHLHFEIIPQGTPTWKQMVAKPGEFVSTQWWGKASPLTENPLAFFGLQSGQQVAAGSALFNGNGVPTAVASLPVPPANVGGFQGPGPYARPPMALNAGRDAAPHLVSPEAFASLKPGANQQLASLSPTGSFPGAMQPGQTVTGQLALNYPPNPHLRPNAQTAIEQNFGLRPSPAPDEMAFAGMPMPVPRPTIASASTPPEITVSPPADPYGVRPLLRAIAANDPAGVKSASDKSLGAIYKVTPNTDQFSGGPLSQFRMPDKMKVGSELQSAMTQVTQSDPFLVKDAAAAIQTNPDILKQLPEHFRPIVMSGANTVNQLGNTITSGTKAVGDWWNRPSALGPDGYDMAMQGQPKSPLDNIKAGAAGIGSNIFNFFAKPKPENAPPSTVGQSVRPSQAFGSSAASGLQGYTPKPAYLSTQAERDAYPTFDYHTPGAMPGYDPMWTRPASPPPSSFTPRPQPSFGGDAHGGGGHGIGDITPPPPMPHLRPAYTPPQQQGGFGQVMGDSFANSPIGKALEAAKARPGFLASLFGGVFGGNRPPELRTTTGSIPGSYWGDPSNPQWHQNPNGSWGY